MEFDNLLNDLRDVNEQKTKLFNEYTRLKNSMLLKNPLDEFLEEEKTFNSINDENGSASNLKTKLRELEKKCALQQLKHEEILLEIESISKGKTQSDVYLLNQRGAGPRDGFYYGETMDKRRGLIPSAYVDDIKCFSNKQLAKIAENANLANLFGFIDEFNTEEDIPGPRNLILEKQLANSAMISWKHPNSHSTLAKDINAFHVYLDGQFKVSVKTTEKPRALIEDVESDRPHRISVRSVTNRGQSKDAQCTIEIGRGATPTPGRLKATKITCNSAKLSWLPGNSNYPHIVFLNDIEIKVCEPGIYKFVLTELPPDTVQRICIQAEVKKDIHPIGVVRRAPPCSINDKTKFAVDKSLYAAFIEFRTLHIGLPDPPTRVQVEPGPQDGFLLVTWRSVKINEIYSKDDKTLDQELPVLGYDIALNSKLVKSVDDHKIDHCLIDFDELGKILDSIVRERSPPPEDAEEEVDGFKILLTVHSIVKKDNSEDKLGPSSKPVLIDNEIILKSAGSHQLAVEKFSQDVCDFLNINESEATRFNVPIIIPVKEDSEEREADSKSVEKSSLTIPAGSVVRQESLSKQEEAVNTAENLLNLRKKEERSGGLSRFGRRYPEKLTEKKSKKHWSHSRSISEGHHHYHPHQQNSQDFGRFLSDSSSSLSLVDHPTSYHNTLQQSFHRDKNYEEYERKMFDRDRRKRANSNIHHTLHSSSYRSHSASRNMRNQSQDSYLYPRMSLDGNWPDLKSSNNYADPYILQNSKVNQTMQSMNFMRFDNQINRFPQNPMMRMGQMNRFPQRFPAPRMLQRPMRMETFDNQNIRLDTNQIISQPMQRPVNMNNQPNANYLNQQFNSTQTMNTNPQYQNMNNNTNSLINTMNMNRPMMPIQNRSAMGNVSMGNQGIVNNSIMANHQLGNMPMNSHLNQMRITNNMALVNNNNNTFQQMVRFQDPQFMSSKSYLDSRYHQSEKNDFRIFIAIYDYDPLIMSPNPSGFEEELPFKEGQLVKIYGDCDEDGFYVGECNGRCGLIPSNMVTEIEIDTRVEKQSRLNEVQKQDFKMYDNKKPNDIDNKALRYPNDNQLGDQQNFRGGGQQRFSHPATLTTTPAMGPGINRLNDTQTIPSANKADTNNKDQWRSFVAMYDYDPHLLSPNVDVEAELAFVVGDEILVHGSMDEDGFYYGQLKNGKRGLVPSNFLKEVFDNTRNTSNFK